VKYKAVFPRVCLEHVDSKTKGPRGARKRGTRSNCYICYYC